jgi:hypothetical protein
MAGATLAACTVDSVMVISTRLCDDHHRILTLRK